MIKFFVKFQSWLRDKSQSHVNLRLEEKTLEHIGAGPTSKRHHVQLVQHHRLHTLAFSLSMLDSRAEWRQEPALRILPQTKNFTFFSRQFQFYKLYLN